MLGRTKFNTSLFILPTFAIGWYVSIDLLADHKFYYTILTFMSTLAAAIIIKMLQQSVKQKIHLWIIFVLFIVGYYVKFYVLCYFQLATDSDYIYINNPAEAYLLNNAALLLNYYEVVTVTLYMLMFLIAILTSERYSLKAMAAGHNFSTPRLNIDRFAVKRLLGFSIFMALVFIYVQIKLEIGFVSFAERQATELPFRMAGVIMTIYNGLIPLMFLITVWLADYLKISSLKKVAVSSYLLFGITAGLLSTSKASLVGVVVSLTILWLSTDMLTRKRKLLLLSLLLFIGFFNGFLGLNRVMRVLNPDSGIFEIMWITGQFFVSIDATLAGYDEPLQYAANFLGLIMRINGADSLLHIIDFAPAFSLERILYLLFVSPDTIATLYAQDVLNNYAETGVAFSPSLLGYFYFVFGNGILASFGLVMFATLWHVLLEVLRNARLQIEPIAFSLLIVTLGKYMSEGTLESMPQSIALIIGFTLSGEYFMRLLNRKHSSPTLKIGVRG